MTAAAQGRPNRDVLLRGMLQRLRHQRGLSQDQLAALLRKPQSFISKIEAGTRRLDVFELLDILAALETPPDRFLKSLLTASCHLD